MKNMKKSRLVIIIAVALTALLSLSIFAAATYDSTNDPLISLSYLTKYVNEALEPIKAAIGGGSETTSNTFEAIFVEYGKEIQCTAATEVILRSGTAVIVAEGSNGISDLTDGKDLKNGTEVPKNHDLLIPRGNDGRGIKITSEDGAYVMVGGAYKIV